MSEQPRERWHELLQLIGETAALKAELKRRAMIYHCELKESVARFIDKPYDFFHQTSYKECMELYHAWHDFIDAAGSTCRGAARTRPRIEAMLKHKKRKSKLWLAFMARIQILVRRYDKNYKRMKNEEEQDRLRELQKDGS